MTTHADREAIAEAIWPGTAARGIHELNRRLITIYEIEDGKDGGLSKDDVEAVRAALLERMAEKEIR